MEGWAVFDPPFLAHYGGSNQQVIVVAVRDVEFLYINGDGYFHVDDLDKFRNVMRYDPAADKWYDVSADEEPL